METGRVDTSSRIIKAGAGRIYKVFMDPAAMAQWRPPKGMKCIVYEFNGIVGGHYKIAFEYLHKAAKGKSEANADLVNGVFKELMPGKKIVEEATFESNDPAFANPMIITTILEELADGTKVTFIAEHIPAGITPEDHKQGMESTLRNLAEYLEE